MQYKKVPQYILAFLAGIGAFALTLRFELLLVQTSSMEPTIPKATIILVDKTAPYKKGDVITFKIKDSLVTHRLIQTKTTENNRFLTTKGDANNYIDKIPLTSKDVLGRVIFTFPYLGYAVMCLIHPLFLLLFFYIPVGHYFGKMSKKFVNQIRN
ncbi:signal peptidase I [candidate division WWE3 bacterium]|nr:signal peptidase I [candidate division WWE3 bacterium]